MVLVVVRAIVTVGLLAIFVKGRLISNALKHIFHADYMVHQKARPLLVHVRVMQDILGPSAIGVRLAPTENYARTGAPMLKQLGDVCALV